MRHFTCFKVVALLVLTFLTVSEGRVKYSRNFGASNEINEIGDRSVATNTETTSLSEYVSSGVSTVKRMINALPSPNQILHYGKQALIGVPGELAYDAKRFLCESELHLLQDNKKNNENISRIR